MKKTCGFGARHPWDDDSPRRQAHRVTTTALHRGCRQIALVVLALATVEAVLAQAPRQGAFDVASIRPSKAGEATHPLMWLAEPGSVRIAGLPLRNILVQAFADDPRKTGSFSERIRGGDPKLLAQSFDVVVKGPIKHQASDRDGFTQDNLAMLRSVLVERFGLRFHYESALVKGFAMSVARPGRLGPHLQRSTYDCQSLRAQGLGDSDKHAQDLCVGNIQFGSDGELLARDAGHVGLLAEMARAMTSSPVLDETGLDGTFEWEVSFTRKLGDAVHPSIFTAFREQLGLQLLPKEQSVRFFVIDQLHMPSEN
jgi:uncharacterized protein (TIGR03435 family)